MKLYFQDTGSIKSLLREALLCTILRKQDVSPYSLILCSESIKPLVEIAALDLYTSSNEFLNKCYNVLSKEGEMCGPGTPIVQIVNSSTLKIVAQVPENF